MNKAPLSPEILVPRLGEYLVEKNIISRSQLEQGLDQQQRMRETGAEIPLIGQVLIELNIVDRETLDIAITEQIIQLRAALQEANQQLVENNQQLERRVQERTAELQRALEKLSELNQLKANIVANISHELRTPLTHLKGYLELLIGGDFGPINESQKNAMEIMGRSSERLGRLIEDLILFSLSERDKMVLRVSPFSAEALCVSVIHKAGQKARERNITLGLQVEQDLPKIEGDEEKISWVVLQFLDNAIKFTQPGGNVILRVSRKDRMVEFSTQDTGIGIPPSRTDEIFESFYQLDGSTTRRAGGTGLGLALAKKIIESHGSIIQVTSDVGKGSCFTFMLKVHNEKPGNHPA